MGFRADLKPVPKPGENPNILQPRKTHLEMPRWKMAQDDDTFKSLLELLESQHEVAKEASSVLNMICTNHNSFWSVLNLSLNADQIGGEPNPNFSWDQVFDTQNIKLTMYNFEIINSIIKTHVLDNQNTIEFTYRRDWVDRFLKEGGFQQLLILLNLAMTFAQSFGQRTDYLTEKSTQARKFVARTLRLLSIFLKILMSASELDAQSSQD